MRLLIFIVVVLLIASCRSTKKIQTAIAKKDTTAVVVASVSTVDSLQLAQSLLNKVQANHIDFTTFSSKINVDYKDADDKNYNVNAHFRMYKDSAIWVSINAILGIEALRAMITKDSVKILDKQNKLYTARSIDYLQEVTSLPLNLKTLQDLIIGNPVFLDSNVIIHSQGNGSVSLISIGNFFKHLLTIREQDNSILRSKLDDIDVSRNRTADLTYTDYETKKGPLFSTKRQIIIAEKKKLDIKLEFKQYDFNGEVSFPFSIPKNYKYN